MVKKKKSHQEKVIVESTWRSEDREKVQNNDKQNNDRNEMMEERMQTEADSVTQWSKS